MWKENKKYGKGKFVYTNGKVEDGFHDDNTFFP
jgi:hypothetical protein